MALTKEKMDEIGHKLFFMTLLENGFMLKPTEIKREIHNRAKKYSIPSEELAEFAKEIIKFLCEESTRELDEIINGKVE